MDNTLYVGIDVSKNKLDVAVTYNQDKILSFNTFHNTFSDFEALFVWVKNFAHKKIHFCLEATNIYHEQICEYLISKDNTIVSVVNPAQTKYFAKTKLVRTKTDRTDSELIAFYAVIHKPKPSQIVYNETKELRELTRHLKKLIDERIQQNNRLKITRNLQLIKLISKKTDFIENEINEVEKLIKNHINKYIILKEKIDLLKTITGIGDKTASTLLSEMLMIDDKPVNSKAQTAYAGLDPAHRLSGSSLKARSRISATGNAKLRRALFMSALCCVSHKNGYFKEFYTKLTAKGKPKKVALTAVMRKLLVTANGVLLNNQPFQSDWAKKKQNDFLKAA